MGSSQLLPNLKYFSVGAFNREDSGKDEQGRLGWSRGTVPMPNLKYFKLGEAKYGQKVIVCSYVQIRGDMIRQAEGCHYWFPNGISALPDLYRLACQSYYQKSLLDPSNSKLLA